jgi:cytochrome c biogenesis protein ResB
VEEQEVKVGDRGWRMSLRFSREYHSFSVKLLKTTHEVYPGTISSANPQGIPKNFQSRVRIENPQNRDSREVDIYMNNPLRYAGLTFYQYQMGSDELDRNRGTSVLQVVRNPGWLTPYLACILVGGGLIIQFLMHLAGFIKKRRIA